MPTANDRRMRAWGRGPYPARLECLESRQLLAAAVDTSLPDIVGLTLSTQQKLDWGDSFHAVGSVTNQGTATTTVPFKVGIYASTTPAIGNGSVLLGEATIPSGLAPGGKASFDQVVNLPAASLPNVDASGNIYINTAIDPEKTLTESSTANNSGNGQGIDTTIVTITPHPPAQLVGSSLGVSPDQTAWGSTVQLTAQIQNAGQGDAPATRASIVLTPSGASPGGVGDVTLGHLDVPAIAAGQSTTITQALTLPNIPPTTLVGGSTYTLSIVTDSDYKTNLNYPHVASKGLGFDMTQISITTPSTVVLNSQTRADLKVVGVTAPSLPVALGQTFQVTANIQNTGNLDAGPMTIRYLLAGSDGSLTNAVFLADTTLNGLKAGYGQNIVQNLTLPLTFPSGFSLGSDGKAKVAVIVNPDNTIDELDATNNSFTSNAVPIQYVDSTGKTVNPTASATTTNTGSSTTSTTTTGGATTKTMTPAQRARSMTAKQKLAVAAKRVEGHSITHNIKAFPKRLESYVKNLFKL